ncbi:hypothetical protein G9O61_00g020030 [Vairimorpha ceranae]|nr:hypothetical protein G9O61_00g020850 [Vairimorpha ceranae]KAF5139833.1 hypothetical protein G9O61_00g020030 [Vairimorpha ceranae]
MDTNEIQPLEALYLSMIDKKNVEIYEKEGNTIHRGYIVGFDEYMNIVIETGHSRYLLKGDCILSINIKKD